jgi:hypothetical protein
MGTKQKATTGIDCMTIVMAPGGSEGCGLLAGHPLLTMASASKLKQKIMDIWAYLKKESTKDFIIVDMNLVQTAI